MFFLEASFILRYALKFPFNSSLSSTRILNGFASFCEPNTLLSSSKSSLTPDTLWALMNRNHQRKIPFMDCSLTSGSAGLAPAITRGVIISKLNNMDRLSMRKVYREQPQTEEVSIRRLRMLSPLPANLFSSGRNRTIAL